MDNFFDGDNKFCSSSDINYCEEEREVYSFGHGDILPYVVLKSSKIHGPDPIVLQEIL